MGEDEMKIIIQRHGNSVSIAVKLNGEVFDDSSNFQSKEYAKGHFADIFHFLTSNRYKRPTSPLSTRSELEEATNG